ncbi:TPA: hypothetical protein I8P22_002419 [Salmonella enterica subsp. enterica serovar Napoli]|nr:hypothetical protein [Salmonella enterica subsp. enterica serovar Napoli]
MCQKCQDRIVKTQQVINEVGAENIVEMLSAVVGNESISPLERFASVMEFGSIFKEPIEVLSIAHYFGGEYLAEKDRSKKLRATLEMLSEQKYSPAVNKTDETVASKDREIVRLKSSLAMLISAFKLMTGHAGFDMPDLKSDDPMAVRQMLGSMADQLDAARGRLEDMMRELTHRHDLNKQPHKTLGSDH